MDEINPYASPIVPDPPLRIEDNGIGVWRDRNLLVMHRDAPLPPICIRTGQAADEICTVKIRWRPAPGSATRRMSMEVPLSRQCSFWQRRGKWIMFGLAAALVAAAVVAVLPVMSFWGENAGTVVLMALGVPAFVCLVQGLCYVRLLEFVRVRGNYFWFRGANSRFLNQLPIWHFGN